MNSDVNIVHEQTTESKICVDRSGFKETDFDTQELVPKLLWQTKTKSFIQCL